MPRNSNTPWSQKRWAGGIADYPKESANGQIQDAYYFGKCINYRDDPQAITLLPGALKESGGVVKDLLKWGDRVPSTLTSYFYGDAGNFYQRTSAAAWSNLHKVANSHGNGLAYFSGDDYLYYTTDATIGRYGPARGTPQFTDDFLTAQAGIPTNTASLLLVAASSQYCTAADSASLSITGDLTLETFFKANSLPTVGNSMTLIGKWDESNNHRSYKLDLFGVSGYFGSGSDNSRTISSNTTEAPIDSACTGTAGTQTLSATNPSFAVGQVIFIWQTQGTNAGQWERNTIQGYTAGTITLGTPLIGSYTSGAQVIVMKQYTNVTVNNGVTWTAKAWNGTTGGILIFLANGTVTVNGTITASGKGFRGGSATFAPATQGEGTAGIGTTSYLANGNGGGGASSSDESGAGGGNATAGASPSQPKGGNIPQGGNIAGSADLTTIVLGGGGGGGENPSGTAGQNGGGVICIFGTTITISGAIVSNGNNAIAASSEGAGGAGAGGSILLKSQVATLGTGLISAIGGLGANGASPSFDGISGAGGTGRIVIDYLTSFSGTTTPTLNAIQDNTLVTTATIQARLGISNDGTNFEYLTQNLTTLATAQWNRLSVAWTASTSTAQFYDNAGLIGSSVGTKTAIHDNASLLYVGADKGASVVGHFFDGLLNDMRIWSNVQTASQIANNNLLQLQGSEAGLEAYYTFNSIYTDTTANANTLTQH